MTGKTSRKAILLGEDRVFELDNIVERVLAKQCPCYIDRATIFVSITPDSNRVEIFQGKAEWIDLFVTAFTVSTFAMLR